MLTIVPHISATVVSWQSRCRAIHPSDSCQGKTSLCTSDCASETPFWSGQSGWFLNGRRVRTSIVHSPLHEVHGVKSSESADFLVWIMARHSCDTHTIPDRQVYQLLFNCYRLKQPDVYVNRLLSLVGICSIPAKTASSIIWMKWWIKS